MNDLLLRDLIHHLESRRLEGQCSTALDVHTLEAFIKGTPASSEAGRVRQHLTECLTCLNAYAELLSLLEEPSSVGAAETQQLVARAPGTRVGLKGDPSRVGMLTERVVIDERFCGFPRIAHGGYVCGVVAAHLGPAATVSLRNPPPLNRPLEVKHLRQGLVALLDGEKVIAEGTPGAAEIEIPTSVSVSEAEAAACRFPGLVKHPFPRCFVCGPQRAEGDGLRIFPGQVARQGVLAAPWVPSASIGDADGRVRPEFVWAAMDCPGGWALLVNFAPDAEGRMVTGQIAATVDHPLECGAPYVVVAWPIGSEGRRLHAGTAIFSPDGELCAAAKATWIVPTWGVARGPGIGERES